MFSNYKKKLNDSYQNAPFIIRKKVHFMFLLGVAMYTIVLCLPIWNLYRFFFLGDRSALSLLLVNAIAIGGLLGTFWLFQDYKRYYLSINYILIFLTIVFVYLYVKGSQAFLETGINQFREFFYFLIALTALMSKSRRPLVFVVATFLGLTTILFIVQKSSLPQNIQSVVTNSMFRDSLSFLLTASCLYIFSLLSELALNNAEQELEKNKELNANLEQKVIERTNELNNKNNQLEQSNQKIISSIEYAQRIQSSLLPSPTFVKQLIPENFIIWNPRDIVGGDVYYMDSFDNGFLIVAIDCTGHGVPGAFMTMLASSSLRRITIDERCLNPSEILKRLNAMVKTSLQQDKDHVSSDDGLDASVCFVNPAERTLTFAGARLPLTYIHNGRVQTLKGDRHSIGYKKSDLNFEFTSHQIKIEDGMTFYLYTDGIIDQLGGEKRMSMGSRKLKNLFLENQNKSFDDQKDLIIQSFEKYKGDNETQDDITVIGFCV